MKLQTAVLTLTGAIAALHSAAAQSVSYNDEAAFRAALVAMSYAEVHEGFESDGRWGNVRTPVVAPSIWSRGVTWSANGPNSGLTTGQGAARRGNYGLYQLPHGDWVNGIRDGFIGTGDQPMVAIGGWIRSSGNAVIELRLDGVAVDFHGNTHTTNSYQFFGAIDPAGFSVFEWEELEATPDDWKLLFADDFRFAFGGSVIDCNQNGIGDAVDIASGTSSDCNDNFIPDECEIAAGSPSSGGPFFCLSGCDVDCNRNGILDECEVLAPVLFTSGVLSPIGDGAPQTFTVLAPPQALAPVSLSFEAHANLGGPDEFIDVDINGVPVGTLFINDGDDCPDTQPTTGRIIVPASVFNSAVAGGNAVVRMVASTEVDADDCSNPSSISVELNLHEPSALDLDANGIPDGCEGFAVRYCVAGPNSVGASGANIYAFGSNDVADNNLTLRTLSVPSSGFGLHFFGPSQVQVPFGDGTRCVGGMLYRLPITQAGPDGVATYPVDLGSAPALGVISSGVTMNFQFWYRDTAAGGTGFNVSDAVQVAF